MTTTVPFADALGLTGRDLGVTEWRTITQEQVNTFAGATDDHQWIHVDPDRANEGPFGGPIAHGMLTLSLGVAFWSELLDVTGVGTKINYGFDRVRFLTPVPVGGRVRMQATIATVTAVKGGIQLEVDQTIELEGASRPALVARAVYRFLE